MRVLLFLSAVFLAAILPHKALSINDGSRYAARSVLSDSTRLRVKIKTQQNAIYKLTYEDLKNAGFADPSLVKVFGYGGWILPEDFQKPYIDDLPEVAVYTSKNSEGKFGPGCFLLFYARGTVKWEYNSSQKAFEHDNNPYSTAGYYFLVESDTGPKEMETKPSENPAGATSLTTFDDYALHETDKNFVATTGRELFGENFAGTSAPQTFPFSIPGITNDDASVKLSFAAASGAAAYTITMSIGNKIIDSLTFNRPQGNYQKAYLQEIRREWKETKSEQFNVTITPPQSVQPAAAYLNYIALNVKRNLKFYDSGYTFFRNTESITKPVSYEIANAKTDCQIWDITENYNTKKQSVSFSDNKIIFLTNNDNVLHEYVMINPAGSFPTPETVGAIEPQNLHAMSPQDMIIISPKVYLTQAERIAEQHRQENLRVEVVEEQKIFNEFSSGTPDATAYRRFMKMFYDRALTENNADDKPKYLLLFGDGLFDNRHLSALGSALDPANYLLTYQYRESLLETTSYGTDDYFGFLDDTEGTSLHTDKLDIGIGRFPVNTTAQAENVTNKTLNYIANKQPGNWKNKIIFTADNTDSNKAYDFCTHAKQSDQLAQYVETNYPENLLYKYFMDTYKPVVKNGATSFPEAKKSFLRTLKEGCLLLNYTGHGSPTAWSQEDMLNIADVRSMDYEHLPLWITSTCDFGWFDAIQASGGEEALLNKNSGAIALFTTSRVVYSSQNFIIHDKIIRNLFRRDATTRQYARLGEVLRQSKLDVGTDANKLNYVMLGDPALRLNFPQFKINIDTVNGLQATGSSLMQFRALDNITLKGSVRNENGDLASDFTGEIKIIVCDAQQTTYSTNANDDGGYFSYTSYPNQIFVGQANVVNGEYEISFVVPLDINYSTANGKMMLYAFDENNRDASGSFDRYYLNGTNEDAENDNLGPEITAMFLNAESFKNGDNVNTTPYFYASVFDQNGINFSGGGGGHNLMLFIDNKNYTLNEYYQAVSNNEGSVGFAIPELAAGEHQLLFRVWDIMNNYSEASLSFNVVKDLKPDVFDLAAYENEAGTEITFRLNYNMPETAVDIQINVYTLTGQQVKTLTDKSTVSLGRNLRYTWDLQTEYGRKVSPGIYIYRALVRTSQSEYTSRAKKIIIK